jgi:hypothetical protein
MKAGANKNNAPAGSAYEHLKDSKTTKPGVLGNLWSK